MTVVPIDFILYSERMVGQDSPLYDDTLNRALKTVVSASGYLEDGTDFAGFAQTVHTHDADAIVTGTLDVARGGTNIGTYVIGDTLYASGATTLATVAIGALGSVMTSTGSAPQWVASLNTSQGGTGVTSYTAGDLPYYASGTAFSKLGIGSGGQFLRVSGSAPSWATLITSMITDLTSATTGITSVGTIATGVWHGTAIDDTYLAALSVSKLTGTTLPASVVNSSLTALGTVATGVWQGTQIANAYIASGLDVTKLTTGTTLPANVVTSSLTAVGTIATGVWQGTSISTTYTDAKVKTVTGTGSRVTIGGTATDPTFDISASYVGQATITTLGTVSTGTWAATTISVDKGGTGLTSYTLGDVVYASGATTLAKLAGNTGTQQQFLIQTGNGAASAAPSWHTFVAADITDLTSATTGITKVGTVTTGVWNATIVAGTYGGTGVNNGSFTVTLAGNLATAGAFNLTLTTTNTTNVTLPTSGTLVNTAVTSLASLTSVGGAFAISGALTGVTTLNASSTATVAQLTISTAVGKIVPGATSLSHRNNADNADNILIADAGAVTFRGAVSGITTLAIGGALSGVTTIATSSTINSQTISATASFTGTVAVAGLITGQAGVVVTTANGVAAAASKAAFVHDGTNNGKIIVYGSGTGTQGTFTVNLRSSNASLDTDVITATAALLTSNATTTAVNALTATSVAGTGTIKTTLSGQTAAVGIGQLSNATTYSALSLNDTYTNTGILGLSGGASGDLNMYLKVPSTGTYVWQVNNVQVAALSTAGALNLSAGLTATLGSFSAGVVTSSGSSSVTTTAVAYTIADAAAGSWLVSAWVSGSSDVATAIVGLSGAAGATAFLMLNQNNGGGLSITIGGTGSRSISVNKAGTNTIHWAVTQLSPG